MPKAAQAGVLALGDWLLGDKVFPSLSRLRRVVLVVSTAVESASPVYGGGPAKIPSMVVITP